ncbi:MAG: hypothetical protein ACHQRM_08520 [Bacteroidia bacterium]
MNLLKILPLTILLGALTGTRSLAQDPLKEPVKKEATLALAYYKLTDQTKSVLATVKARNEKKKFVPAANVPVHFYVLNGKDLQSLEKAECNSKGEARVNIPKNIPMDEDHAFTIIAKIENDPLYEDTDEKIKTTESNLTIKLNPKDTAQNVTAHVSVPDKDGKEVPVKDVTIKFYVQRMFGVMPAGEGYSVSTDEKGDATYSYPKRIAGDTAGAILVVAKIVDNDQLGNIETKSSVSWGSVLLSEKNPFPRALWEPYAPMPLVLTISILFGGVWCAYFYIFRTLFKIKKMGKKA